MEIKEENRGFALHFSKGKDHAFRLWKESALHLRKETKALTEIGDQEIQKIQAISELPKKKAKHALLTQGDKKEREIFIKLASIKCHYCWPAQAI